ncbi:MAG: DUF4912 domain-containing protein [Mojavia pulchra JT2-VF2]|jgi:phosphate transport system substrate-binding protein|uniref:DUF4912 domain-containing protein n=1 Tax=Mojavia pulchra JT2-VF2 TaxID=287848 RepID=A0A951Q1A8_9NOST|nr:DUF4912 domain-containing protein [Mojavia pulchra JT2-VF2]
MWQQEKKDSAIVQLALLLAIATMPMATTLLVSSPILAQSPTDAPSFPLPQTVENGTTVRIDGSSGLAGINQSLKQSFEKQFSGTKVEVAVNGTDAALKALLDGQIDIAALGRGLTPEEKAQGLEQVRLHREKIAIIVSADNPFQKSLTSRQFARIFRGQITNWSQLGGPNVKIRVIDRPATSDTRNNFRSYPAFKNAEFTTGSTATQIAEDNTAEIVKQLGNDGISYALANQVSQLPGVRVLQIHQTSPDDPKYPFSQPLVYVYKQNPNVGVAGFLGFAIAPPGQQAIEEARTAEAAAIAKGELQPFATNTNISPTTEATTAATADPTSESTTTTAPNVITSPADPLATPVESNYASVQREAPFWLLLPLLVMSAIGGLSYWLFRTRRPSTPEETDEAPDSSVNTPSGEPISTVSDDAIATTSVSKATSAPVLVVNNTTLAGKPETDIWSDTYDTESDPNLSNITINSKDKVATVPKSGEAVWETEAPAAVVNTSYPHRQDVPKEASQAELLTTTEISISNFDVKNWDIETTQDQIKEQPQAESNIAENINSAGIAAGAVLSSINAGSGSNTEDTNNTIESSDNNHQLNSLNSGEAGSEGGLPVIELAATIPDLPEVNEQTSEGGLPVIELAATIPDLPEVNEQTSEGGLPVIELAATIPDLPEAPEQTSEGGLPVIESAATIPDLPEAPEQTSEGGLPVIESAAAIPDLSQVPELALNAVADAAESTAEPTTEEDIFEIFSDLPETTTQAASNSQEDIFLPNLEALTDEATVAADAELGPWATIYGIEDDNAAAVNEETVDWSDTNVEDSVILRPHTPMWAYVSWVISDVHKQVLQGSGSRLALRLYDVTDLDLSYQSPQFIQQYECEEATRDYFVEIPKGDRDYIAEIGYATDGEHWVSIARSATVRFFSSTDTTEETADSLDENVEDIIFLKPRTPDSAYVWWLLSDTAHKQVLQSSGSRLALRLYDVTDLDLSYQSPQFIQQYECDEAARDHFIDIPKGDRDYIVEIGYPTDGDRWVSIARSATVRVFNSYDTAEETADSLDANLESSIVITPRTPKWAYVCWYISDTQKETLHNSGTFQLALRLYDVTDIDLSYQNPQLVQQYECEEISHDRFVAIPTSDRDYIAEIGYIIDGDRWVSIARSATVRVFSRPHTDFWFVADAELIIHGATQPDATVSIAGHSIKLKPDGTFHLRVPFSDSLIDYLIEANAADGTQTKTIHKLFSQETPKN